MHRCPVARRADQKPSIKSVGVIGSNSFEKRGSVTGKIEKENMKNNTAIPVLVFTNLISFYFLSTTMIFSRCIKDSPTFTKSMLIGEI